MRWFLFLFLLWIGLSAGAQQLDSKDKKALKWVEKAELAKKSRLFDDAIFYYQKAIEKDPNFSQARLRMANVHAFLQNKEAAEAAYESYFLETPKEKISPEVARALSNRFFRAGKYALAKEALITYGQNKSEPWNRPDSMFLESINFAQQSRNNPLDVTIESLGDSINRFALQYFPVLTIDNQKVYFTRRRGIHPQFDEDIVVSVRENGQWGRARSASNKINTQYNEGACSVSADGRTMIFTACEGRKSYGNCDLFITRQVAEEWTKPENMGQVVNSAYWDSQPSLSADGRQLYFASNRPGGYGKRDIWLTRLGEDGWEKPRNLGNAVNTPTDETTPFIHVNGESLFFASDGHKGLGGFDIFLVERKDGAWGLVKNLGYPVNDHRNQSAMFITADGQEAYFTRDERDRSFLYRFILNRDSLVSKKATYLTGKILDDESEKQLIGEVVLYDLESQEELYRTQSDPETGRYFMALKADGAYGAYVSASGYLFQDLAINLRSTYQLKPDTIDFRLKPIAEGNTVILKNIYFEFDSYEILESSVPELKAIAAFLKENPIIVEIGGHTDSVGGSAYNQDLSEKRAQSVYNYLLTLGVEDDQVTFRGYGFSQPIKSLQKNEQNPLNRRIEFKIVEKLAK